MLAGVLQVRVVSHGKPVRVDAVAARIREVWVDVLYSFATSHPEVTVRVNAMQTLRAVVGGPASLRAEDWQHWWHQRQVERGEA